MKHKHLLLLTLLLSQSAPVWGMEYDDGAFTTHHSTTKITTQLLNIENENITLSGGIKSHQMVTKGNNLIPTEKSRIDTQLLNVENKNTIFSGGIKSHQMVTKGDNLIPTEKSRIDTQLLNVENKNTILSGRIISQQMVIKGNNLIQTKDAKITSSTNDLKQNVLTINEMGLFYGGE